MAMELKHLNPQHVMDVTGKAIDEISRLRAENAELKEQYKDMDVTHTVHIAKMNARIEELESSLESEKASRYADSVDAGMRERRLKRALYKACANWAMAESYSVLNDVPTSNRWVHTLRKLKEKLEEYK